MSSPDPYERGVRFGCGFFLGVLIGLGCMFVYTMASGYYVVAALAVFGVVFGLLAVRYGDALWLNLQKFWWW